MKPLRIVAHLAEPIVYLGDGMTLDGILAAAVMRDLPYAVTSRWPTATRDEPWLRDLELPLARWAVAFRGDCNPLLRDDEGRLWGWRCSSVHADWLLHGRTEVRKRSVSDELKRWSASTSVNSSAGRFKSHDLKLPSRFAARLTWFAVGNRSKIERLLSRHIQFLGRKVGQGNGRVLRWEVDEWSYDWSVERDGKITRPMPRDYEPGVVRMRGIRAPYWHPSRLVECVIPDPTHLEGEAWR